MDDSLVLLYHGGAGGGKTMSADVQCIIDMVAYGQTVYSMVPISFDFFEDEDDETPPVSYESMPWTVEELLRQDEKFRQSVILWDEINLWLFSRSHASVLNKLVSQLVTLRRKLDLSFYATSQFLSLVDKNFRIQIDAEILCFDLHYAYHNLSKGQVIHQELKDISGKFTGRPYEHHPVTYERLLHSQDFKGTYDTKKTFNIFEAQRKYRVKQNVQEILPDGDAGNDKWEKIEAVKSICNSLEGNQWLTSDIQEYLGQNGITGTPGQIGRMMKAAGYVKKQIADGQRIYIREEVKSHGR